MKLLIIALLLSAGANAQTDTSRVISKGYDTLKEWKVDTFLLSNGALFSQGKIIIQQIPSDTSDVWIAYIDTSQPYGNVLYRKAKCISSRFLNTPAEYRHTDMQKFPAKFKVLMSVKL